MKQTLHKYRLKDLLQQRNLLLFLIMGLLMLNVMQATLALFRDERIVVIPPDSRQEFWVLKDKVSASYLEEMSVFFADLILETTPSGAAFRRDIILRHASPRGYGDLKTKLLEDEKRLKKAHLSTSFQPMDIKVDPNRLSVEITGDLTRYIGNKRISQARDTYRFEFEYKHSRLLIKSFSLIKGESYET